MNIINFFTLGYEEHFLRMGLIMGTMIAIYLFFRVRYALKDSNLSKNKKYIVLFIFTLLPYVFCLNVWSFPALLTLYFFFASLIADFISIIYKLLVKDNNFNFWSKFHKKGFLAILIFAIIVIVSANGLNHIEATEYNITTDKIDNNTYSIVWISDTHYGTIQDKQVVKEAISKINDTKPDIVVLGGDIIEERTSYDDTKEIFKELGEINSTYGTFFVYGNHEHHPAPSCCEDGKNPLTTEEELNKTIKENGIQILDDDKITINDDIVLVGRSDEQGNSHTRNLSEIANVTDFSKYLVVLDHKPIDCLENSKEGADLQISGHYHGGQTFPLGLQDRLTGHLIYGEYKFGDMKLLESSGMAGWGKPIKNEGKCEYVVINIS